MTAFLTARHTRPEGAREPRVYPGKHLNLECALKVVLEFSHVIERFFKLLSFVILSNSSALLPTSFWGRVKWSEH